jgi:hypothetical protein
MPRRPQQAQKHSLRPGGSRIRRAPYPVKSGECARVGLGLTRGARVAPSSAPSCAAEAFVVPDELKPDAPETPTAPLEVGPKLTSSDARCYAAIRFERARARIALQLRHGPLVGPAPARIDR